MTRKRWFALDLDYWRNPKVSRAGFLAGSLNIAGIAYCAEQLTDGFIPYGVLPMLAAPMQGFMYDPGLPKGALCGPGTEPESSADWADDLVVAGLWRDVEGGWEIVNYLEHQPSREDVEDKLEQAREAGRLGGLKRSANRTAKRNPSDPPSGSPSGSQAHVPAPAPRPEPKPQSTELPAASQQPKAKRATQIPDTFPPDQETADKLRAWAEKECPLVPVKVETDQWLDYHRAKGDTAKDWISSWRMWIRNAQKYAERNGHTMGSVRPLRAVTGRIAEGDAILTEAYNRGQAQRQTLGQQELGA